MSKLLPVSVAVAVAAVLAGCASTPPEDDPVQIKLNDLDARVARIERVVSNQSLVQLAQNLDSVQAETRRLRGRIEELENSNEQMKKQLASSASVGIIGGGANANNGAYGAAGAAGASGAAGAAAAAPVRLAGGDAANAAGAGGLGVGAATGAGAAAAAAAGSGPGWHRCARGRRRRIVSRAVGLFAGFFGAEGRQLFHRHHRLQGFPDDRILKARWPRMLSTGSVRRIT